MNALIAKRTVICIVALILLATIFYYAFMIRTYDFYVADFRSFYAAARIVVNEPENLYDLHTQEIYQDELIPDYVPRSAIGSYPFLNPAVFLLPFIPLTPLPIETAYFIMMAVTLCLAIAACFLLIKLCHLSRWTSILFILVALSFAPTYAAGILTQSSCFTLLLFTSIYYLLTQKRWFPAGILAGLMFYKPQMGLVLVLYLLLMRKRRIYAGLSLGILVVFFLSLLLTKGHLLSLVKAIPEFLVATGTAPQDRISWAGLFYQIGKYLPRIPVVPLAITVSVINVGFVLWLVRRIPVGHRMFPAAFSAVIVCTLLSVFHVHIYELVMLLFPLGYLLTGRISYRELILIGSGWILYFFFVFNFFTPFFPGRIPILPTVYLLILQYLIMNRIIRNLPNRKSIKY